MRVREPAILASVAAIWAFLILFLLWPLASITSRSFSGENGFTLNLYREMLSEPRVVRALGNSLFIVLISTLSATLVGFLFAYAMTRVDLPAKRFFRSIVILQLVSLPFASGLAFLLLFGRGGLITSQLLGLTINLFGWPGLWVVQTLSFFPLAYLVIVGVLKAIDPTLEYAAQNLGASGRQAFINVLIPLATPGLASAALLVALNILADFGNPFLIGGDYSVLATEVYLQVVGLASDIGRAAVLSVLLLIPALAIFLFQAYWVSRRIYVTVTGAPTALIVRKTARYVKWPLFAFCCFVSTVVIALYVTIGIGAFTRTWGVDYRPTLEHVNVVLIQGIPTLRNALSFSVQAAAVASIMGILTAYTVIRGRVLGRRVLDFIATLPSAVPGTALGIGYVLAFNTPPIQITGTSHILVLNHVSRRLPVGFQAGSAGLRQIDKSIEEASMNLGATQLRTIRHIVLPLLKSAFGAGFFYTLIKSMTTVSAAVFLVTADTNLPSVVILGLSDHGYWAQGAALAVILLGAILATVAVARIVGGRKLRLFDV